MALSKIPTNTRIKKGLDPAKKKILFVLGLIFAVVVIYGFYNLKSRMPSDKGKIPIKLETGDRPMKKKLNVIIKTDGFPLNIRKDHDEKSEKVGTIPDKTKVEAEEEIDGWYKITYNGKTGWVSKKYTVLESDNTASKPENADWQEFKGASYTFKFPKDWYAQNYTGTDGSTWIAISNNELPASAPSGSYFIPVELKVYPLDKKPTGGFRADASAKKEPTKVGGVDGTKYNYINSETSTEINVFEVERGGSVYDFYDNGGYIDDLNKILATFTFM